VFDALPVKTYGNVPFTLPKTSDKGLPLSYKIVNTEVATLGSDGYTVTIQNAGTTDIVASQAGDATHYAADPVTQTLTVNKATQSIAFAPFDPKQYGDPAITLNEVTDRNLTIKYTSNNDVVSINGNIVTINKVGTTTITATQEGNKNYLPADPVSQVLSVGKAVQVISFGAIENRPYGSPDFTLPATTNQGLTITYTCDNTDVAEVSGNTVKVKNAGTCNITASQDGTENYEAASSVTQSFTVTKAYQEITFDELPAYTYGCAPITLSASSNKGGDVNFESSDQNIAKISGNTMTIVGAGKCYITAKSKGNNNLYDATPVQRQLVVNKASQTISLEDLEDRTYGDVDIQLVGKTSTGKEITYTSSNTAVLDIIGSTAKIKGAGDVTITATQKGDNDYEAASTSKKLHINKAILVVKADNQTKVYGDANPALTISYEGLVNGDTPSRLKQQPKATTTATASSGVGVYDITIATVADDNYSMNFQNGTLTVTKAPLVIKANDLEKVYGNNNPTLTISYNGFKLSDTSNKLTTLPQIATSATKESNVGDYPITVEGASATNYEISYVQGTLSITKATLEARIANETVEYGDNPKYDIIYSGFKLNDDKYVVDIAPRVITSHAKESYPGSYEVHIEGGLDNNYTIHTDNSTHYITVVKAPLYVSVREIKRAYMSPNPDFTLFMIFEGLKNNDTKEDLHTLPTATCSAKQDSWYGEYSIVLSGGYDPRYNFHLVNGTLYVVTESESAIEDVTADSNRPVKVYSLNGQLMSSNATEETLKMLPQGIYIINGKKVMVNYKK
ncbi:MAG: MBG-2 domain-containing protein, partial [Bacteroidaceae bacterium]|nr:MBG-2 domain-containing protein [Bacteroidaceae bacterium]